MGLEMTDLQVNEGLYNSLYCTKLKFLLDMFTFNFWWFWFWYFGVSIKLVDDVHNYSDEGAKRDKMDRQRRMICCRFFAAIMIWQFQNMEVKYTLSHSSISRLLNIIEQLLLLEKILILTCHWFWIKYMVFLHY